MLFTLILTVGFFDANTGHTGAGSESGTCTRGVNASDKDITAMMRIDGNRLIIFIMMGASNRKALRIEDMKQPI